MPPATQRSRASQRILGIVCLGILAAIAVAGLTPFNPFPKNNVAWIGDGNGLRFGVHGIALASANLVWPPAPPDDCSCSLEILLRPERNNRVNNILTFYTPDSPQRFRLFQWADSTLLLYRDAGREHREIDIEGALRPGSTVFIAVTAGARGTSVYLDGVLEQTASRLRLSRDDLSGRMILGTSPLSAEPWSGEIRSIALYAAQLTPAQVFDHFAAATRGERPAMNPEQAPIAVYDFDEGFGSVARDRLGKAPELSNPASFQIPHKRFLSLPSREFQRSRNFLEDVVLNVAAFAGLGFFLCLYRAARTGAGWAVLYAIASGAAVSLFIESLQMVLPTRTSSIVDLAANTAGAALGALLCIGGLLQSRRRASTRKQDSASF